MEKAHKEEFPPLLPEGFHRLSIDDVRKLCVDPYPDSIVRGDIMAGLCAIVERIAHLKLECEIWLDGSFITQKQDPEDVDFIIFAPMSMLGTENPELDKFIDWMNDKKDEPKTLFKCHTQIIFEGATNEYANDLIGDTRNHYRRIFGFSVTTNQPKGIVLLNLKVVEKKTQKSKAKRGGKA